MHSTLFIADLHLSATSPERNERFIKFLSEQAPQADALYILGDLWDAWVGDDDLSEWKAAVENALRNTTGNGLPVYAIHGNRDFTLGRRFSLRTGVQILQEP